MPTEFDSEPSWGSSRFLILFFGCHLVLPLLTGGGATKIPHTALAIFLITSTLPHTINLAAWEGTNLADVLHLRSITCTMKGTPSELPVTRPLCYSPSSASLELGAFFTALLLNCPSSDSQALPL